MFRCRAEANPAAVSYSWLVDGRQVEGGVDQPHVLVLPLVTRSSIVILNLVNPILTSSSSPGRTMAP